MARSKKRPKAKKKKTGAKKGFSPKGVLVRNWLLVTILSAGVLAGAFYGLKFFFLKGPIFKVNSIVLNKDRDYSLYQLKKKLDRLFLGKSIFAVDLGRVRRIIKNDHPQLRKVEVRRELPDTLEVDITSRRPSAVIDSGGGIVIDREAVVLAVGEGTEDLIKIRGISFFLNVPPRGERIKNDKLDKGLVLADGLRHKMRESRKYIEYVDISDRNNIVIGIKGVKVNMGAGDFSGKIDRLNRILIDPDIDLRDIKYIDLRFDDVVIAPK